MGRGENKDFLGIDLDPDFMSDGHQLASELVLPVTAHIFAQEKQAFEASYFDQFEDVCAELQARYS